MYFGNVVKTTPVIGESGGLLPAVDVSTIVGADMTNNSIEEELRLTVAFDSTYRSTSVTIRRLKM